MGEITNTDGLARAGYFARAAVYGLLGYFAFASRGIASEGPIGAFAFIHQIPAGDIALVVLTVGLAAYGLYKLAAAALDLEGEGTDIKGVLKRLGIAAGGIAYLGLAYAALRISAGLAASGGGAGTAGDVLRVPFGAVLLAVVGLGFLVAAALQLHSAWTKHFLLRIEPGAPQVTGPIGQIGLGARSAVFAIVGWSLIRAAWSEDASKVRDLGGALRDLRGWEVLYLVVAIGLVLFAIYSAIEGRYRIVPRVDIADRARERFGRMRTNLEGPRDAT